MSNKNTAPVKDYKFGFNDGKHSLHSTKQGINENVIREISKIKNEPQWMLDIRLKAFHFFMSKENPVWGPDLSAINFDKIIYYIKTADKEVTSWDEVPPKIKNTFSRLGIPEAEAKWLSGAAAQYDSEMVYHNMLDEFTKKGVIFTSTDQAVQHYPEIVKRYFGKIVPYSDNKYAALNTAVWSGGSFIYVPKGVKLDKPLQSYFRINAENAGQFERTLIIVEEGSDLHYVEGCTAPIYAKDSLHAAVVEVFVKDDAKMRYTTIQNWSDNVYNLVTKRAKILRNSNMEWIDGNIGSKINMKYPAVLLAGEGARASCISIAVANGQNIKQDAGAKMIHLADNTQSQIVSKSIASNGGEVNYRGLVQHMPNAFNSRSKIECDTMLLDDISKSDTIPTNVVKNNNSTIEHEATVSKISDEELFYLMSRGLSEGDAREMIIMGFIEPFARELPMEYAVELNHLIALEIEGDLG